MYRSDTWLSHGRRVLSIAVAVSFSFQANKALAVDMDIAINDIQRRDAVAPHCAALKKSSNRSSAQDDYRKGLCLLYGVQGKAQPEKALLLLRQAAGGDLVEAQLALAEVVP